MRIIKRVRAPVRIDFGGGTTDIYPFTHTHGGIVLNAAINRYVEGMIIKTSNNVHLEYTGNTPTSSGLGTSGVMNLVWLALISEIKTNREGDFSPKNKVDLAEQVYKLEQSMGLVGGKQDQYAAAFGGINYLQFKKDKVLVEQLKLPRRLVKELERRLVLVYMGKPHFSGHTNKLAIDNLIRGKNTESFIKLKEIAREMKKALLRNDLYRFAELLNQETRERHKLHLVTIDKFSERFINKGLKKGAIAAKMCGSGGGGSVLFFSEDRNMLKKTFGKKVIDFKFDFKGLQWI